MHVTRQNRTHPLERFCAIVGAALCLILTIAIWRSVSGYQAMWPLPALYFIEIAALSIFAALSFVRGAPSATLITWPAAGVLSAFSILGAWSVGFFYLPVALLFTAISGSWDVRNRQSIPTHLGLWLIAGGAQAALMLIVVRLLE